MSHKIKKQRFQFIVAVHAFFFNTDQVLLLERASSGYMDGFFSVPAGHVDGGESIEAAMKREIQEEIGITIEKPLIPSLVLHRFISAEEERIDFFFSITQWQGKPHNNEPHKCAQLLWKNFESLPSNTVPYISHALDEIRAGKRFSQFDERSILSQEK